MKKQQVVLTVLLAVLLLLPTVALAEFDLTGRWTCSDGGTYYLRQENGRLYWYGEDTGRRPAWASVFSGKIDGDRIHGRWADVPKGRRSGSGTLEIEVGANGQYLRKVDHTGVFSGVTWRRRPERTQTRAKLRPTGKDACAQFNPRKIDVERINGRWRVTAGVYWLFDFGTDREAAIRAAEIIDHYRMDRICTIGRPDFALPYLLAKGGAPTGAMAGETCIAIDPHDAMVTKGPGGWVIVSEKRKILAFGSRQEDARRALAIIRQHDFTHICTVGKSRKNFSYFRK